MSPRPPSITSHCFKTHLALVLNFVPSTTYGSLQKMSDDSCSNRQMTFTLRATDGTRPSTDSITSLTPTNRPRTSDTTKWLSWHPPSLSTPVRLCSITTPFTCPMPNTTVSCPLSPATVLVESMLSTTTGLQKSLRQPSLVTLVLFFIRAFGYPLLKQIIFIYIFITEHCYTEYYGVTI